MNLTNKITFSKVLDISWDFLVWSNKKQKQKQKTHIQEKKEEKRRSSRIYVSWGQIFLLVLSAISPVHRTQQVHNKCVGVPTLSSAGHKGTQRRNMNKCGRCPWEVGHRSAGHAQDRAALVFVLDVAIHRGICGTCHSLWSVAMPFLAFLLWLHRVLVVVFEIFVAEYRLFSCGTWGPCPVSREALHLREGEDWQVGR